jgi:hypothetical protein
MADEIAKAHELAIANRFVEFLNEQLGTSYGPAEASEAPDALTRDPDGNMVGIEVTCGYYDDRDAKDTWQMARATGDARRSSSEAVQEPKVLGFVNPDAALISSARDSIDRHCLRRYGIPTYLVVDLSHAALTTSSDAPAVLRALHLPRRHWFQRVYVGLTRNYTRHIEFFRAT